jgi:cobalt/nickel transport system permease protein
LHLDEGVLSGPYAGAVLLGGAAVAGCGVAVGLWRLDEEKIPQTGVMAAALFVASLIHVTIGPGSAHLTLVGLAGVLLGWAVFPAVLVALLLQAVLFQFGGLTTLGINTLTFAIPAVVCHYLFGPALRSLRRPGAAVFLAGSAAGFVGMLLSCVVYSGFLLTGGEGFENIVSAVLVLHIPILLIEGFVTGTIAVSLKRLRPEIFDAASFAGAKGYPHG